MAVATSLIPGLDEIIKHGDPDRRAEAARRITELYFEEAATLRSDHVDLFDGALINLVPATETARVLSWQSGWRSLPMRRADWSGNSLARTRY